ncbi:protein amnionless [Thalassophryne amazonica]|uniref:protein amnionless n=1 Tax=Thalassophryne amazonica TaxID=390379 RepID=UPI001470E1A5|nr:protein amnionless [Thalassophryne amazonica]
MLKTPDMLLLFLLVGAANALFKQWIPDNNYENKTNWDKGYVPCGNDKVQFPLQRKTSVFVETAHAVRELTLPLDGEFILNPKAGFYVTDVPDPNCGQGVTAQFKDSGSLMWFNPNLWQVAATQEDLQMENFLFSVHEESVPCQYDDVVFKAQSSFSVDTTSNQQSIAVKSVSVFGKILSGLDFALYLQSASGRLQFHGSSKVTPLGVVCDDPSGCVCENSVNKNRICSSVTCPSLKCLKPLQPLGHCCEVCGAIVTISYSQGFDLNFYRELIKLRFLGQPMYKSIQMGMSKVVKPTRFMGIPFGTSAQIQVVLVDGDGQSQSAKLARDITKHAHSEGQYLGITGTEFQASSGEISIDPGPNVGMIVGVVIGVLTVITLVLMIVVLIHKGIVQIPPLRILRKTSDFVDLDGPLDHGFENPMFDKPTMFPHIPGLSSNDMKNSISLTQTGVYFINPVYDDSETDFNA